MTTKTLVQSLCARAKELVANGPTLAERRALSNSLDRIRYETLSDRVAALEARHREVDAFYVKTCLQALKEHIDWRDEQMVKKFQGLEIAIANQHMDLGRAMEANSVWGQTISASIDRLRRAVTEVSEEQKNFQDTISARVYDYADRIQKTETAIEEIAKDTDDLHANIDARLANHEAGVASAVASAQVTTAELAAFREAVNRVLRIEP